LPTMASMVNNVYESTSDELWATIEKSRLPMEYLASLFSAGDTKIIEKVLKKMMAVRVHRRNKTVGDMNKKEANKVLKDTGLSPETADAIFRLTSLPLYDERFVIPPAHREEAIEMMEDTHEYKGEAGLGFTERPKRGL
ncbi:MAG: hypothetical protein K9G47_03280, partial [Bacteroidales bacterium]|nr:hypothetical protein [Bacteroidales bacterium]